MPGRLFAVAFGAALGWVPLLAGGAALPHFTQPNAIWNQDVSNAPLRSNSAAMMTHLEDLATAIRGSSCVASGKGSVCWGDTRVFNFQIDLSFYALHANASTPTVPVVAWPGSGKDPYYYVDCDDPGAQTQFPVPVGGGIEGTSPPAYACDASSDDCHLLVANDTTKILYESYGTDSLDGSGLHTHCALKWDLTRVYPRYGRGEHCTSADGAGFPIAPLLFNADEVWAAAQVQGDLGHAIRFILGNNRMMAGKYVHPSSHGTSATSDANVNAVPYGSRLRLKSTFNVGAFSSNEGVRAILRTLQKYGMFLSDGGGIPLTGEADDFNDHKWDTDLGMDTHSLWGIRPTDFEVIEAGVPRSISGDCTRTPEDFLFIDGNEY
jgi:serine/threonine-protein kinase